MEAPGDALPSRTFLKMISLVIIYGCSFAFNFKRERACYSLSTNMIQIEETFCCERQPAI